MLVDLLLYFIIYSVLGWLCEVGYRSVVEGYVYNSGFLNGPYCPIYGFGALLLLTLLAPYTNNAVLLFFAATILTTLLEGIAGYLLHKCLHARWWDYSEQPFNIGGYVCLAFSIVWGLGSVFILRITHPFTITIASKFSEQHKLIFVLILLSVMSVDFIVTIATVMKLNKELKAIDNLSSQLHKISDNVAEKVGETAIELDEKRDKIATELRKKLKNRREELLQKRMSRYERLFKAFPGGSHDQYDNLIKELRELYRKKK